VPAGHLRVCSQGRLAARAAVAVCRHAADCTYGGDGRGHVIGISLDAQQWWSQVLLMSSCRWLVVIAVIVTVVVVVPSRVVVVSADDIVVLPVASQW